MSKNRLSGAEIREFKQILARVGAVDLHFTKGLITAHSGSQSLKIHLHLPLWMWSLKWGADTRGSRMG